MKLLKTIGRTLVVASALVLVANAAQAQDKQTVVIASFGSVWQDVLEKALVPFEQENNVDVKFTAGSSSDNVTHAIATKDHPDVDVVMGEDMTFAQGLQAGIFVPLDPNVVTNLKNVAPKALVGNGYGVGTIMQSVGMFYNTKNFAANGWPAPTSWQDLVDRKYCNRIGFMDPSVSFAYYALMMLGGGKPDDIPAGIEKVVAIQDCLPTIDPSAAKHIERAQLGEFDLGVLAHQLVLTLADAGAPLKFFNPKEGGILQFTTMAVTKNAPNPAMAQKVINELLSDRVQQMFVSQFKAGPVVTTVSVPPELVAAGAPDPKDLSKFIVIDGSAMLPDRAKYQDQFKREMAQ
jgi:putative spermidine/putrescine transport system substrate-binding protein